jgi:hypothetical protein
MNKNIDFNKLDANGMGGLTGMGDDLFSNSID